MPVIVWFLPFKGEKKSASASVTDFPLLKCFHVSLSCMSAKIVLHLKAEEQTHPAEADTGILQFKHVQVI